MVILVNILHFSSALRILGESLEKKKKKKKKKKKELFFFAAHRKVLGYWRNIRIKDFVWGTE